MADLVQINLLRKANGQEPLTELPVELGGTPAAGGKDKEPTAEEIEAKRKTEEEAANAGAGADKDKGKETPEPGELSDEALLQLLSKRGISAASLEDLKPKEVIDEAKLAEQREASEIAYGLSKGLYNKSEYDQFVNDTKDIQDVVYADFYNATHKADPELSDEDIQAEFLAKYGLDAEKGTRKFERGLQELKERAAMLIKTKHSKIFSAKDAFGKSENETKTVTENQKKVAAALPVYRKDVEDVFGKIKKLSVKFSDTEEISEDIEEGLKGLKDALLDPATASNRILAGYTKEGLEQQVLAGYTYGNFSTLVQKFAKKYFEKHAAGGHGVDLGGTAGGAGKEDPLAGLTESQKKYVEMHKASEAGKKQAV